MCLFVLDLSSSKVFAQNRIGQKEEKNSLWKVQFKCLRAPFFSVGVDNNLKQVDTMVFINHCIFLEYYDSRWDATKRGVKIPFIFLIYFLSLLYSLRNNK